MTDTIKKGTVLWAIDQIPGWRFGYLIKPGERIKVVNDLSDGQSDYMIQHDDGRFGFLHPEQIMDRKLFSLTPPEDKGVQTEGKSDVPIMVNDIIKRMEAQIRIEKLDILSVQHQMKDPTEDQAAGNELLKRHQQEIDGFEWCIAVLKAHQKGEK